MVFDPDRQLPGSSKTANDELLEALIRHQIFVLRFAGGLRTDAVARLEDTEPEIRQIIRGLLSGVQRFTPRSRARLDEVAAAIAAVRGQVWNEIRVEWLRAYGDLARSEVAFNVGAFRTVAPVIIEPNLPAPEQVRAITRERPFEGRILSRWARDIRDGDLQRIHTQIQVGLVQGETVPQIARRVVGARGVARISRRDAEMVTRTAAIHVSNQARREVILANRDIIEAEVYTATLDSRTTPICRSLDGEQFEVGDGPIPPLHPNCRSLRVAILDGEPLGLRPMKPTTERGLLREFSRREGFRAPRTRAGLPHGTRGRFDRFARQRVRELTGQVPAKTTYQEFLRSQSQEFQDDVLGQTRARLFRRGGLTLDKFVGRDGDQIPLRELARRDADAFRSAGLDPEDFL